MLLAPSSKLQQHLKGLGIAFFWEVLKLVVGASVLSLQSFAYNWLLRGVPMGNYRDRLQIIADILLIASERARKTRIMYQANLSYKLLCRYLGQVVDAGLVRFEDDDCYVLTGKGKEFLSRHEEYAKRCQTLEEQSNHVSNEKAALEKMCFDAGKAGGGLSRADGNRASRK